ncbi:hypothetical protein TSOC111612_09585 [Tsukamurella ocularis]
MDVLVPQQSGEVSQRLVPRVEEAQLHELVRRDVVDNLHAGVLESRSPGAEGVLEHPLGVRLGHHGPAVVDARPRRDLGAQAVGRRRGDPVDHRVGEAHVLGDPVRKTGIGQAGEGGEGALRDVPVALDVVARHDREGGDAAVAPPAQGLGDVPEDGARRRPLLQIVPDVRVLGVELAGGRGEVVAAFRDGEGDDAGLRRREPLDHGLGIVGAVQVVDDRPDDGGLHGPVGMLEGERVEPALRDEGVAHRRVGGPQPDAADAPARRVRAGREQPVDVDGLVGAMEAADAEVDDPGPHRGAVVVRHGCARDRGQGGRGQVDRCVHHSSSAWGSVPARPGWTTALMLPGSRSALSAASARSSGYRPVTMPSRSTRPLDASAMAVGQVFA